MRLKFAHGSRWFNRHPFPLLVVLEGVIITSALLVEALPRFPLLVPPPGLSPPPGLLGWIPVVLMGLLGFWIPERLWERSLSIGIQMMVVIGPLCLGVGSERTALLLSLIVMMRGCLLFGLAGRLTVSFILFLLFAWGQFFSPGFVQSPVRPLRALRDSPPAGIRPPYRDRVKGDRLQTDIEIRALIIHLRLNGVLQFGLMQGFVLLMMNSLLSERRSRQALQTAHDQLREYALKIEDQAMSQERSRIARDIHDALGHTLAAQSLQLENALLFWNSTWNPEVQKIYPFVLEARRLGSEALQEVRDSVGTLRLDPLQRKTLNKALQGLVEDYQRRFGILPKITLKIPETLPAEVSTTLYRLTQEALTNISKHAQAQHIDIDLVANSRELILWIRDDGQGFNPAHNSTGFGLRGMQERVLALRGHLNLISQPGQGCSITVRIPRVPGLNPSDNPTISGNPIFSGRPDPNEPDGSDDHRS